MHRTAERETADGDGTLRVNLKNVKIYVCLLSLFMHILYNLQLVKTVLYIVFLAVRTVMNTYGLCCYQCGTFTAGQLIILPALPLNVSETRQLQIDVLTVSFRGTETKNQTLHFDVFGQLERKMWKIKPVVLCRRATSLLLAGYLTE